MKLLTDDQKRYMVKDLLQLSKWQVALKYGLDKHYAKKFAAIGFVNRVLQEVKSNPEKFTLSKETIELIEHAMEQRKGNVIQGSAAPLEPKIPLEEKEIKELVETGSKKAWIALNRKLDMVLSSKKRIKESTLKELAFVAGVAFDKRQIVKGEATEHILLKAKVSEDLSPTQKLQLILEMRESVAQTDS